MEPTQDEINKAITDRHEADRKKELISKHEVMIVVKQAFCSANANLKNRSTYDQTVMGNMLTVIELELKKDLKELKSTIV